MTRVQESVTRLEPIYVELRHLHQIRRIRSAGDECVDGMDRCGGIDIRTRLLLDSLHDRR